MAKKATKGRILKLENNPYALDFIGDAIIARGYTVTSVSTLEDALDTALRDHPDLIIAVDHPERGVDGRYWLELQHTQPGDNRLAMTPLLILVEGQHMADFAGQEIPGRVAILQLPLNLRLLEATMQALLSPWGKLRLD